MIPQLAFPLFFFAAFAGGLSRIHNVPGFDFPENYTSFQFVFVLLQSAAFGGVFTGFGIARDFEGGFAKRLLLAAPHRTGIVLGYAAAALVRWLVTAAFLTVVGFAVGIKVGGNGVDLPALYLLAAILNTAALFWACGVAMRLRTMQAGPVMQMPVFLVLFFAPVYVPLNLLNGWIHDVAVDQPGDTDSRSRPQFHRRPAHRGGRRLRCRRRAVGALLALGDARPAQGRAGEQLKAAQTPLAQIAHAGVLGKPAEPCPSGHGRCLAPFFTIRNTPSVNRRFGRRSGG